MDNNSHFVEPDLTIGQIEKCKRCNIARAQILLINCRNCGNNYCVGFIDCWKKNHINIKNNQECNPKDVDYVSAMSYDIYTYDEAETKSKIFSNPENNTFEYNIGFFEEI
jgi:hypothetical protein